MKQAILIVAHKDLSFIQRIINHFDGDFDFFLHIDKNCRESIPQYKSAGELHVIRNYHVRWGSWKIMWAIYDLLSLASKHGPYSFFHLITGNCYPVQTVERFKTFFSEQNHNCYVEYHPMPRQGWGPEGGIERIRYYWVGNQHRDIRQHFVLTNLLLKIQRKTGLSRNYSVWGKLYCGGWQSSLSAQGVTAILAVPPRVLHRRTRYTHACEEIVPQTILLNSPEVKCVNDSLHLSIFEGNAASPRMLTEADMPIIKGSGSFFVRKVDPDASSALLSSLDASLCNE